MRKVLLTIYLTQLRLLMLAAAVAFWPDTAPDISDGRGISTVHDARVIVSRFTAAR